METNRGPSFTLSWPTVGEIWQFRAVFVTAARETSGINGVHGLARA